MRAVVPILLSLLVLTGCAASSATTSIVSENDLYNVGGNRDRYYTNGVRASAMFPVDAAPEAVRDAAKLLPGYERAPVHAIGVALGQNMYTPEDITIRRNQEQDRPWAAWSYIGLLYARVEHEGDDRQTDRLESFELDLGVVGPSALGEEAQRKVHQMWGSPTPRGWDNQLHDEPAVLFSYDARERWYAGKWGDVDWDAIAGYGGALGNVRIEGRVGGEFRLGHELPRDFGASTIRRASVDVAPGEKPDGFALYGFIGGDGYLVSRNIFLDGNTFRNSHDVRKEPFVAEARAGIAIQFGNLRLSYAQNTRSPEFKKQDEWQRYGTLQLECVLDF